jgi:flagellar basal-body rod protein FlgC
MPSFDDVLAATNISGTGMAAERLRMEVVANNIANAFSTRSPNGGPFRRQDVVFAAVLHDKLGGKTGRPGSGLGGVEVAEVVEDPSEFVRVYEPGHPDADADGMVSYPNVHLEVEMTNLLTASRAYEANVNAAKTLQRMMEQSLALIRA